MSILKARAAIEEVEERRNLPVETVIKEIESAIEEAMKSSDPRVQQRWMFVPRSGDKPTALEFVSYMRELVHGDE